MAKNVQGVLFLRNGSLYNNREAALENIQAKKGLVGDGQFILARYGSGENVKTLVGVKYGSGATANDTLTVIDIEGASAEVEALRQEINAKLGTSFISSGNTVEANLTALSGDSSSDTSATTSVEGAKKYADQKISDAVGALDYTGVTTGTGIYVTNVTQSDGVVSATTAELPSVTGQAESKKVVISVSEDKGEISVVKGEITSEDGTVVLTDNTDGGIDFSVNIDNETLVADTGTGVISVASTALTQYVGDENTIHISAVDPATNTKTISSFLTIEKVTTGLSEEVKEEYHLVGSDHVTIGDPVKIYKDSHIVSINYITDSGDTHYQNLEYVYIDASGATKTVYIDMSELVLEAEFASGVTVTDGIAHGVVDPQSEKDSNNDPFLTVGENGFKVDGIKEEIAAQLVTVVENLDADVSGSTAHITVNVVEENGVITDVNVEETKIADADDLAELSGKTITAITSENGSITATINDAVGNKTANIETDASKIKMSGFTVSGTSSFSGIAESDSVSQAFDKANAVITENERVTAAALNDLDERLDEIESGYVGTVKVNNVALPETDHAVNVQISGSTAAGNPVGNEAITVVTDPDTGAVTLGLGYIDCGEY
jgi:hypothetical protein